jgi:hypothetical protein
MRNRISRTTLATVLVTALIGTGPAAALPNVPGHEWPTANDYQARQQGHEYDRGRLLRQERLWDPWGHWGSYYGPMIH